MENQLQNLFQYSRDAVVCIKNKRVLFANSSAAELFGCNLTAQAASRHIPAHLLDCRSDSFVSCADISGHPCSVLAARCGDVLLLTFQAERARQLKADFLSDGLMASMASALCNIGLSVNLISERMETADAESRRCASVVYHNYYTLKRLMGNLSAALAFESGTAVFLPRSTDLALLCSDLVSTAQTLLHGKAQISFSTQLGELMAKVDPDLIERLLLNLISNSSLHTPPEGKISLGLTSKSGRAVISVDDNGSGIPARILKRVFAGYELSLSDDLTGEPSGGLGLGICRSIAEIHGGSIIIESREGVGTCVRVMLPLGPDSLASPEKPPLPSMENILTEFSCLLASADYARELMD